MGNFYKDNEDLQFYLKRAIDWKSLWEVLPSRKDDPDGFATPEEAVEFYEQILESVGALVATDVAPHSAQIDKEGVLFKDGEASFPPTLQGIFDKLAALDLHGMCLPRELGGLSTPITLYWVVSELLARGDVSILTHFGFTGGIALTLLQYSIEEGTTEFDPATGKIIRTRFAKEIESIAHGHEWGSMDITEPHAGSDMAQLRTRAEQDAAGRWFVSGQKIFITSGHGKYHIVIARTEEATHPEDPFAGLQGLSLFLVPAFEDRNGKRVRHVTIDRLEDKLGQHACVTAAMNFDRAPAQLIGKRGEGFKYMLTLMNGARLSVGFMSLGICEAAYRAASAYARERTSMGKTISRHELIADYLDEMRTDIQGLRALSMRAAFHEEMGHMLGNRLRLGTLDEVERKRIEKEMHRHRRVARRLTPLIKYFGAEKTVEITRRAVQIHGGNGYMQDYPVEKLLRDAVLIPIYEGTSQIQSLMAMKDTLNGIMKRPRGFVLELAQARWRSVSASDLAERRVARLCALSLHAQQVLLTRTAGDKFKSIQSEPIAEWPRKFLQNWDPKRDFAYAMLHAERLTRLLADVAIAESLLAHVDPFPERREVLERFLDRAETRCRFLHDEITTTGSRVLRDLATSEATAAAG